MDIDILVLLGRPSQVIGVEVGGVASVRFEIVGSVYCVALVELVWFVELVVEALEMEGWCGYSGFMLYVEESGVGTAGEGEIEVFVEYGWIEGLERAFLRRTLIARRTFRAAPAMLFLPLIIPKRSMAQSK